MWGLKHASVRNTMCPLESGANHPHFVASQDGYQLMVMQV